MKKIHVSTSVGLILNLAAMICLALDHRSIASLMALAAYFFSIKEVSKYTSWYQFGNVFAAAIIGGFAIEHWTPHMPYMALALVFSATGSILRIVCFSFFSYTNHSWLEPLCFVISIVFYVLGIISGGYYWEGFVVPALIILFQSILAWGIIKDKKQLLAHTQVGYRVQIGNPATEFALPDQNGTLVRLSDFKDQRHLLLIFVRGDWCPGCHMMLRTYEKNNLKFKEKNILVMAIGPDPVGVNRGMVEKLGLDFKVLSDEGQRTASIYGVQLKEYDNDFAEKYEDGIPLPASFLIDKKGIVRYVSRPDKVGEFLNPSLIFPIIDQLDSNYKREEGALAASGIQAKETIIAGEEVKSLKSTIEDLKKQLSNYESIIDQANDAMMVIDIVDGKIHQSNPSASKLLEYTKEELEKLSLFDLHPQEYLEKSSCIVADVWEKGGLIYKDIPFITKTKKLIPVECSAKVAPFAGRPAIVIYARDITERLKLEAAIAKQNNIIKEKNKDITDSIEYSKRIQRSVFIEKDKLKDYAPDSFIFFKPKDLVSGDFYWFTNYEIKNDRHSENGYGYKAGTKILVIAAVDCTGHGVPGAFMSIIGNALLNQTLNNPKVDSASHALDFMTTELKKSLHKNNDDVSIRDGMDMCLCCIDLQGMRMEYAGANNPLYIVRNKELIKLKADKQPITASIDSVAKPFTNNLFDLQKGDCIYLFTDGFADQFGGPKGKKFMYKQFGELLVSISDKNMNEQKTLLYHAFQHWRGNGSQVDDVLVIGIKI